MSSSDVKKNILTNGMNSATKKSSKAGHLKSYTYANPTIKGSANGSINGGVLSQEQLKQASKYPLLNFMNTDDI